MENGDGVVISTGGSTNSAIDATRWDSMSFNELIEQKNIMFGRYDFMIQQGNREVANKMLEGLTVLEGLIVAKAK